MADEEAIGERFRQAGGGDRLRGALDVVPDAMEHHGVGLGVEREPGCPGVAVPWLADAAGVDQPPAVAGLEQRPVAGLGAADVAAGPVVAGEEEGDVRVADRADPLRLRVEAGIGLLAGEDVLPDRVAGGGVVEVDPVPLAGRLQLAQELQASRCRPLPGSI